MLSGRCQTQPELDIDTNANTVGTNNRRKNQPEVQNTTPADRGVGKGRSRGSADLPHIFLLGHIVI